jgi:hypothetical protein
MNQREKRGNCGKFPMIMKTRMKRMTINGSRREFEESKVKYQKVFGRVAAAQWKSDCGERRIKHHPNSQTATSQKAPIMSDPLNVRTIGLYRRELNRPLNIMKYHIESEHPGYFFEGTKTSKLFDRRPSLRELWVLRPAAN